MTRKLDKTLVVWILWPAGPSQAPCDLELWCNLVLHPLPVRRSPPGARSAWPAPSASDRRRGCPCQPHIEVRHFGNPKAIGALLKAPYVKLPPEDVALLDADPDKRQRYCELVARSWVPPLRVLCEVFMTQVGAPIAARRRHTFLADACAGAGAPQGLRPSHTV